MAHKRPIHLRLATAADAETLARISMEALASNPVSRGLYGPSGTSNSALNGMLHSIQKGLNPETGDPKVFYIVAESSSTPPSAGDPTSEDQSSNTIIRSGVVLGYAKWHFYDVSASEGEAKTAPTPTDSDSSEEASSRLAAAFFGAAHQLRQRHIQGRPYAMVSLLAVDPKYHGRGAGEALVRWGTQRADEKNLDCWIFCTPVAHPLYYKCEFRNIDVLDVKVKEITGVEKTGPEDLWGQDLAHDVRDAPEPGIYRAVLMHRRSL